MAWFLGLSLLSLTIWIYLLGFRGQFWRTEPCLDARPLSSAALSTKPGPDPYPMVCVVIPARDEAEVIAISVRSLLTQAYPGDLSIILVDDHSTDGTGAIAHTTAQEIYTERPDFASRRLTILPAKDLPPGWTGKLWALEQGTQATMARSPQPDFLLLTDADIAHDCNNLQRLVDKSITHNLDMASVMVRLRCQSLWEKLLIPAFVFFFQKLYPFNWANQVDNAIAAAAGGCILLRPQALQRIGGIGSIRHALIDDCALAQAIKWNQVSEGRRQKTEGRRQFVLSEAEGKIEEPTPSPSQEGDRTGQTPKLPNSQTPKLPNFQTQNPKSKIQNPKSTSSHPIWIGLSQKTHSLRPYDDLNTIWDMVARTAYTQLNYSPLLLVGALLGMTIVYLMPVLGVIVGLVMDEMAIVAVSLMTWGLMAIAYRPILRFYKQSPFFSLVLPGIAFMYTLMTLDSALRYWQGRGGAWKGRTYSTGDKG
ncbi:MAG: glycosyltransferase [Cyanobacteria bacterium P01_F01_bin.150]